MQGRTSQRDVPTTTDGEMVGTPRCGVHARQGGTHGETDARYLSGLFPSPDAALGDGDIAARPSLPTTDGAARCPCHKDFEGIFGGAGGQGDGGGGLSQRKCVGDQLPHVESAGEDEPGDFGLQGEIG